MLWKGFFFAIIESWSSQKRLTVVVVVVFLIVINSQLGDDSGRPRYAVYQVSANLFQC